MSLAASQVAGCVPKAGMTSITLGPKDPLCWCALGAGRVGHSSWRSIGVAARSSKRVPSAGGSWDLLPSVRDAAGFGLIENGPASQFLIDGSVKLPRALI